MLPKTTGRENSSVYFMTLDGLRPLPPGTPGMVLTTSIRNHPAAKSNRRHPRRGRTKAKK